MNPQIPELTERDLLDLVFDFRIVSIFSNDPLSIEIAGLPETKVWLGYGGYSWSLFTRGTDCNGCGSCCKQTKRRVWFWWDNEKRPEIGPRPLDLKVNGVPMRVWVHLNQLGESRCDFLTPGELNGQPAGLCGLHLDKIKPMHCHLYPMTGVYVVGKEKIPVLSRRLPPRNWRWPQCPIDVASLKQTPEQVADDRLILSTWADALEVIPSMKIRPALNLWESVQSWTVPPTSNILFRDRIL